MIDSPLLELRRYAQIIAQQLPPDIGFEASVENENTVQVERGTIFPLALLGRLEPMVLAQVERMAEIASSGRLPTIAVIDNAGHHRPVYRGLLIYAWLSAYRLAYETLSRASFGRWEEALRPWCDLLEAELTGIGWPDGPIPAARGGAATESAWSALALFVAGKVFIRDAWTDLASDTFGRLTRSQGADGRFLAATSSDNPETMWYHELALLHAASSYAVQAEDRPLAVAVARATEYHLRETQPDHATSQPWGLFAFIWNPTTHSLADQILHNLRAAGGMGGVSSILLADALYCLRLFDSLPTK